MRGTLWAHADAARRNADQKDCVPRRREIRIRVIFPSIVISLLFLKRNDILL